MSNTVFVFSNITGEKYLTMGTGKICFADRNDAFRVKGEVAALAFASWVRQYKGFHLIVEAI